MSKIFKITLIILSILLISINISFVQATENADVAPISEETFETDTIQDDAQESASQVTSALETLSTSSVTKVSNINSYEQANLQVNNSLSII